MRGNVANTFDQVGNSTRDLFQLSPVFYRQAEAGRYRRPRRTVQSQVRSQDRSLAGHRPYTGCRVPPGRSPSLIVLDYIRNGEQETRRTRAAVDDLFILDLRFWTSGISARDLS